MIPAAKKPSQKFEKCRHLEYEYLPDESLPHRTTFSNSSVETTRVALPNYGINAADSRMDPVELSVLPFNMDTTDKSDLHDSLDLMIENGAPSLAIG